MRCDAAPLEVCSAGIGAAQAAAEGRLLVAGQARREPASVWA